MGGPRRPPEQFQIADPETVEERRRVARQFADEVKLSLPMLVDTIDDQVEQAYAGWPDRVYIVDQQGKIAHKGQVGPRGFQPAIKATPSVLDRLLQQINSDAPAKREAPPGTKKPRNG